MFWVTLSSRSCFCWLYRASSSSAAKNVINLILVLTIWLCPCVESPLVLLEKGVCYDQCVLFAKLLAFALLHFVLQGQTCLLFWMSLDFLLLPSKPQDEKEIKPNNPKGNQSWLFIGQTDAEAEAPILWPTDAKNWLIRKDPEAGKIEGRRRRGW